MLATYANPNAHYQMENDLASLTWEPKGWARPRSHGTRSYWSMKHTSRELPIWTCLVQCFTWKEGWFAVFKTHIPLWATKVIMDKLSDFNTMANFWSTLLSYESHKLPSCLHALAEVEIETVPWRRPHSRPCVTEISSWPSCACRQTDKKKRSPAL